MKASVLFEPSPEYLAASQADGQSIKYPLKIGAGPGADKSIVQILFVIHFTSPLKMGIQLRQVGLINSRNFKGQPKWCLTTLCRLLDCNPRFPLWQGGALTSECPRFIHPWNTISEWPSSSLRALKEFLRKIDWSLSLFLYTRCLRYSWAVFLPLPLMRQDTSTPLITSMEIAQTRTRNIVVAGLLPQRYFYGLLTCLPKSSTLLAYRIIYQFVFYLFCLQLSVFIYLKEFLIGVCLVTNFLKNLFLYFSLSHQYFYGRQ